MPPSPTIRGSMPPPEIQNSECLPNSYHAKQRYRMKLLHEKKGRQGTERIEIDNQWSRQSISKNEDPICRTIPWLLAWEFGGVTNQLGGSHAVFCR
mmetsp:Transcript_10944/g.17802  ORF Transcript_10944/g.17802 Transcript_10944/m.17802 type:complete len:96 (-) Transcript_10944:134-421(-)